MIHPPGHIDPESLDPQIASFRSGDMTAGDSLCRAVMTAVRLDAARMLGDGDTDMEDVVQESLIAWLGYLRSEQVFTGDAVRLAVTIARNRCRDILRHRARRPHVPIEPLETWLTDTSRSPLDDLAAHELQDLLQDALSRLTTDCRRLLHALYVEEQTPEEVRVRSGLDSVQGIYYRRGVCLEKVKKFLQRRLRFGSGAKGSPVAGSDRRTGETGP